MSGTASVPFVGGPMDGQTVLVAVSELGEVQEFVRDEAGRRIYRRRAWITAHSAEGVEYVGLRYEYVGPNQSRG